MPSHPYRVSILGSLAEIEPIVEQWRALARASSYALSEPDWYLYAARFIHSKDDRLHVITLWRDAELVALAPLMLMAGRCGGRYEIIGSRVLYEPAEILARDEQAFFAIAQEASALDRSALLSRLMPGAFNDAFRKYAARAGLLQRPAASGSPYVELNGEWERYYQGLSSKLRKGLRWAQRALSKQGSVELSIAKPEPAQVTALLDAAFAIEFHSWKGRAGSSVVQRSGMRDFFDAYARALAARRLLLVSLLKLDGVPIAMQIASLANDSYWQLKIGYDERHAKHMPGKQLQLETLRWAFEQRLRTYEFLGTCFAWRSS